MKNNLFRRLFLLSVFIGTLTNPLYSQLDDLGTLLSFQENSEKLLKAYIRPYTNALGADLSSGWYNTAKPHKLGGFDLTFTLNTAIVPTVDRSFNPNDLGLNGITSNSNSSPTAMGENKPGAQLTYEAGGYTLAEFELPKGTGLSFAPAPMIQASVGLIKGTEIMGRFTPKLQLGSGSEFGLWGVGLKHSIKQWIPALKRIPVLHLSVMGGYTSLNAETALNFMPSHYGDYIDYIGVDDSYFKGQMMDLEISSFTSNLVVSANLPIVCFYGGVGFSSTNTTLALNGNYPVPTYNVTENRTEITKASSVTDPVDMEIKHKSGSTTDPRYNVGMRLKFAVITIHFDYTYANYSVATAGLGISFR